MDSKNNNRCMNCATDISKNIDTNISKIKSIFENCGDLVEKKFILQRENVETQHAIYVVYIDGLCDHDMIESTIIKPITWEWRDNKGEALWEHIVDYESQTADFKQDNDFDNVVNSVLKGDTAVFVSGSDKALVVSSKSLPVRGIDESATEGGMRGPRDSFNENIRTSTALIRRRIKDPRLKLKQDVVGLRSRTEYGIMYLEDVAKPSLVTQVEKALKKYEIDAIFDSGMAEHLMEKGAKELFPTFQATTRPDKAAASIVEGRVVVVFDNSPEVIIAPATVNTLFQTADDYYNRWQVATFARCIRYLAAIIAVGLPGFYVAVTCYHREVIPEKMLYAIAQARSDLSLPIVAEVLLMELLFELLREAGIRLPSQMGNAIGIVGGIIVGQAAVEAGIVSTIVVIVVALTALASFAIPNEAFASVFRLFKFVLIVSAALWGLLGYYLAIFALIYHLANLHSFGVSYLSPLVSGTDDKRERKDFVWKASIKRLRERPKWSQKRERVRLNRRD
jgi:spore germination protein